MSNSYLVESSAVDTTKYSAYKNISLVFNNCKLLIFYLFYFYNLKIKLNIIMTNEGSFKSIWNIYTNSNWLERETQEMYGVKFILKKDIRRLLLDYTKNENPLLKNFQTEGYSEIFFNFFDEQTAYLNNNHTEL